MIRSMTGIGRAEMPISPESSANLVAEIRSFNHKFLDISVKLPESLYYLEDKIKKLVKKRIQRGVVHVHIHLSDQTAKEIKIDSKKIAEYIKTLKNIEHKFKLKEEPKLNILLSLPGTIKEESPSLSLPKKEKMVLKTLQKGLDNLIELQEREGKYIQKDLEKRIFIILKTLESIEKKAPEKIKRKQAQLRKNLNSLLAETDKTKLLEQLFYIAEKLDITEECVRIRNYCKIFLNTLRIKRSNGRKLSFITQELFKEANTIGAKSHDTEISQKVIKMKEEIEKLKEQLQNVA